MKTEPERQLNYEYTSISMYRFKYMSRPIHENYKRVSFFLYLTNNKRFLTGLCSYLQLKMMMWSLLSEQEIRLVTGWPEGGLIDTSDENRADCWAVKCIQLTFTLHFDDALTWNLSRFQNYWIFYIFVIMLIHANQGNYEKCSKVIIRHPAVSNNWGPMQLISVIRALGTCHFHVHCVLYKLANSKFWCYLADILDLC